MKLNSKVNSLLFLTVAMAALLMGCGNADYQKTQSGILYKIFHNGKKQPVKPGQFVKLHYRATIGDSVLVDTYKHIPAYGQFDTSAKNVHDFTDFLGEMNIGDSVVFIRNVDTMQKRGYLMYNDVFKQGGTIRGYITVLGTFNRQEDIYKDQEQEAQKETQREIAAMEEYLKEQKISGYTKTPKGVFIKIERQGNGPKADSGLLISVNYTGTLKNGTKFDSNVDPAFGHVGPFEFVAQTGAVVPGWDDAIVLLNKGTKAKLFVPAMLAYGSNAQGEKLPAFSDLIFDLEVMDVKPNVAPAQAPTQDPHGH